MSSEARTPKVPDLSLAQSLFSLRSQPPSSESCAAARTHLLTEIEQHSLAPLYLLLKDLLPDWSQSTYDALKDKNEEEEAELDKKLKEAEEMNGESEVSEALIAKFMFLVRILDKVRNNTQPSAIVKSTKIAIRIAHYRPIELQWKKRLLLDRKSILFSPSFDWACSSPTPI
jgi:26S proteasome regulatory subunit N7